MDDRPATAIDLQWERGLKFISRDKYGHSVIVHAPATDGDGFHASSRESSS